MNLSAQFTELTHPLPQALGLAGIGMLLLCLRRRRMAGALFATGTVWLTLCATPAFALWLQHGLEKQYPAQPASSYPRADAIVVLGGGELPPSGSDPDDDATTTQATRAGFGLELFRQARAPVMLLSGGEREAEQMAGMLVQQGVPAAVLLTENTSMTTHQNALYSAPLLHAEKLQRILLVTSAMHMPRAAASFRKQGFSVIPAPAVDPVPPASAHAAWLPQRSALKRSGRCLREYIGLWVYRLRGWA